MNPDEEPRTFAEAVERHAPKPSPVAPRPGFWTRYVARVLKGLVSLPTGMGITLMKFLDPRTTVTQQYPENRQELAFPERFRGMVVMPHDGDGEHKCTGCTLCERACPNGTISILNMKNIAGKKVLGEYIYRYDQCTLCNLCIEACPFDAIRMGHEFEGATVEKDSLVMVLNRKEGR